MNVASITFEKPELPTATERLVTEAQTIFLTRIRGNSENVQHADDTVLDVKICIELCDPSVLHFTTDTDESYNFTVNLGPDESKKVMQLFLNIFYLPRLANSSKNFSVIFTGGS